MIRKRQLTKGAPQNSPRVDHRTSPEPARKKNLHQNQTFNKNYSLNYFKASIYISRYKFQRISSCKENADQIRQN